MSMPSKKIPNYVSLILRDQIPKNMPTILSLVDFHKDKDCTYGRIQIRG